ncbi:MAG: DUF2953 domain-containing protein [Faecalimonas sp.]|nr:DUF2953 domain-containing protein [Faecalimonas sp.]
MLHIVLLILKIIGIVLAALLGILLLAACIVLFQPLFYRAKAQVDGDIKSLRAEGKFSWLFSVFAGYFTYADGKLNWRVRVLWKKWSSEDEAPEKKVSKKEKPSEKKLTEEVSKEDGTKDGVAEENFEEQEWKEPVTSKKKSKKSTKPRKIKAIWEKIKYTIQKICDMIKSCREKKERFTEFLADEVHRSSWGRLTQELFRFFRYVRPRKLHMKLRFGFDDPSTTGKTTAVLSMLYPFYGDNLQITPDFEQKILEGEAFLKGRIHGIHALIVAWNLFFDENIRKTYKDIQNWKS